MKEQNEKQAIEEMAKVIEKTEQIARDAHCGLPSPTMYAKDLYWKGYRKQKEGEWIVTDADSGSFGEYAPFIEFKCPKCESYYGIESGQYGWQYGEPIPWVSCPLCGAKMKGATDERAD